MISRAGKMMSVRASNPGRLGGVLTVTTSNFRNTVSLSQAHQRYSVHIFPSSFSPPESLISHVSGHLPPFFEKRRCKTSNARLSPESTSGILTILPVFCIRLMYENLIADDMGNTWKFSWATNSRSSLSTPTSAGSSKFKISRHKIHTRELVNEFLSNCTYDIRKNIL